MLHIIIVLVAIYTVCYIALKIAEKCTVTKDANTNVYHKALQFRARRLKDAGIIQSEYDFMCGANTLKSMMSDEQE